MYTFSTRIEVPAGATLGGYGVRTATTAGTLEVNGLGVAGAPGWEICSVDVLYAGAMAAPDPDAQVTRVLAASHTHYAPMLDPGKPPIGAYSAPLTKVFASAVRDAPRAQASPNRCTVLRGAVNLPVYRRFDFPGGLLDHVLTRYGGFYPNESQPVDRNVYLFVFSHEGSALFALVYHACHPVTRHDDYAVSADYVGAIRKAVRERFGLSCCLFLLGCSGDIRPNFTRRRIPWLPRSRLNWRFKYPPSLDDEQFADEQYEKAVATADVVDSFPLSTGAWQFSHGEIAVSGLGTVPVPRVNIAGRIAFAFLPFELSHRFHLAKLSVSRMPTTFLVSCAGDTFGYLPHPTQVPYGGYEVDGSRKLMGLARRAQVRTADIG